MSLNKVYIEKDGVKLVYTVELPLIGVRQIEETLKPINGHVAFKEPLQIWGVKYTLQQGKITNIELLLKPAKVPVENIVELMKKIEEGKLDVETAAKMLKVKKESVKNYLNYYRRIMKGEHILTLGYYGTRYVVFRENEKVYVGRIGRGIHIATLENVLKGVWGGELGKLIKEKLEKYVEKEKEKVKKAIEKAKKMIEEAKERKVKQIIHSNLRPVDKVRELEELGLTTKQIAEALNMSYGAVCSTLVAIRKLKRGKILKRSEVGNKIMYIVKADDIDYVVVDYGKHAICFTLEGVESGKSHATKEVRDFVKKYLEERVAKKYILKEEDAKMLEKLKEKRKMELIAKREW